MKASGRGRYINIRWEPDEDRYKELQPSDMAHDLTVYLGKLRPVVSSRCYGGVVVLSRARAKWRLIETRSFLSYMITRPVYNDICLTMVFNSNMLVTVTERSANGTTVYDHVIEDKGRKIIVKFNLDESRYEPELPAEPESQLESAPKQHTETQIELGPQRSKPQSEPQQDALPLPEQAERMAEESRSGPVHPAEHEPPSPPKGHAETQTEPGPQCEEQSKPQPIPSSEAQPGIDDALQSKSHPETQPDPLHEPLKYAAEEAEKIESVRDRLGVSITYLEKLLKIGDVAKDVSRSLQIGTLADVKCRHRYTQLLEFP